MNRPDADAELKETTKAVYDEHEERYGYHRIFNKLTNRDQMVHRKRVQ